MDFMFVDGDIYEPQIPWGLRSHLDNLSWNRNEELTSEERKIDAQG